MGDHFFAKAPGAIQPGRANWSQGAYVMKINTRGTAMASAAFFGGYNTDKVTRVVADPGGATYALGETYSPEFPTFNALQDKYTSVPSDGPHGAGAIFVLRIGPDGKVQFSTFFTPANTGTLSDALLTSKGLLAFVGTCHGSGFPVSPNAPLSKLSGGSKGFLVLLKPETAKTTPPTSAPKAN